MKSIFCFVAQLENVFLVPRVQQIFLFDGQAWKHYSMEIISYNNVYLLYKHHTFEWKYFLFHGLKTFSSLSYQANKFDGQVWKCDFVGIISCSNYSLKVKSIFCLISGCYDFETMVWCMLVYIYIMSLYILLFTLYTFSFPDQYSDCN